MPIAHLEDRSVVAIAGSEARAFLQGLITNDIEKLESGKGLYSALLTPQGRILFDFFLEGRVLSLVVVDAGLQDFGARSVESIRGILSELTRSNLMTTDLGYYGRGLLIALRSNSRGRHTEIHKYGQEPCCENS